MPSLSEAYKILGLDKDTPKKEAKKVYRKLANKYHPDKNQEPGAKEKFIEIQQAWEVIEDPSKSSEPDFSNFSFNFNSADFRTSNGSSIDDILDMMRNKTGRDFGGRGRRTTTKRSPVTENIPPSNLKIRITEANRGKKLNYVKKNLKFVCGKCEGTGINVEPAPGGSTMHCHQCYAAGTITIPEFKQEFEIPKNISLNGYTLKFKTGTVVDGYLIKPQEITINVEVESGAFVKFKDENDHRVGVVKYQEIDFIKVLLGGEQEVETLDGKINLKISECQDIKQDLKISGKGYQEEGMARGDLFIRLVPIFPEEINKEQKEALQKYKDS